MAQGLIRAAFGATSSPYGPLSVICARGGNFTVAWLSSERDLARALNDEQAARNAVKLTAEEQRHQAEVSERLSQIQPRILQLVTGQSQRGEQENGRDGT